VNIILYYIILYYYIIINVIISETKAGTVIVNNWSLSLHAIMSVTFRALADGSYPAVAVTS